MSEQQPSKNASSLLSGLGQVIGNSPRLQSGLGMIRGRADYILPVGILAILTLLLIPLPTWLLDFTLSISIAFSVVILMAVIFVVTPLELSAFPTILLLATMLRLGLNVASTRLILSNGHEGTDAAGQVIQAFGSFVAGGNYVIGIIVFSILVIINFIVITKGAGRIAEVTARFTLDAMPGKQMAVDADLSAGLIDENEARERRSILEKESAFFGAMDGASKFVRGDAIAGILITLVNIVGGIIIGLVQRDMALVDAAQNYTLLTIGDGLVTQIPALVVSTAAGLLVAKSSGSAEATDKQIFGQLSNYFSAMVLSSVVLFGLAITPGLPFAPFLFLCGLTALLSYYIYRRNQREDDKADAIADDELILPSEEPISSALQIDLVRLELGYGLLPLINANNEYRLTDQIKALRWQIASECGFIMPAIRIQDNLQLPSNSYVVVIKEIEAGRGDLRPNMLLAMDPRGEKITIAGESGIEPTFGLPATWINETSREEAMFRGYTVVDPSTVITTHLTELVKNNMHELLSYGETQKLLDELPTQHSKLVGDLIPSAITLGGVQRVLQNLLQERVSIRDLPTILEGVYESCSYTKNVLYITEHVRARLSRQISNSVVNEHGIIMLVSLSPEWEQSFIESVVDEDGERQLAMAPSALQEFTKRVKEVYQEQNERGISPVMLVSPAIRPYVRTVIERFNPNIMVISQNEIHVSARIRTIGLI
ncbi:MAG: flagellar biosynthesis protein FlhA [Alphaproteobacteria bacterium]|nr:flagellar biosynthesis protein FlhA [Alphaproteobacteria bacterium]